MALSHWLTATRPKTLPAGIVPVAVGAACAARVAPLHLPTLFGCGLGALLIQIGCNFANDAFDAQKGADTAARLGPTRAVAAGLISARAMHLAAGLVLVLALGVGVWLSLTAGWPILLVGLCSVVAAVLYTGGPWPYGYHGLGEVFVLVFFGFCAVLGTGWCLLAAAGSTGHGLPGWWWALAAGVGLQATAILTVNNLRDRSTDAPAGKRTLAVRLGGTATRVEIALLHFAAVLAYATAARSGEIRGLWLAAGVAAAGGAILLLLIARREGRALNPCLAASAALELITGACVVMAVVRA